MQTQKSIEAINQLTEMLNYSNAEQIAIIESYLAGMGLTKLAEIAHEAGRNNAGDEYEEEYHKACHMPVA